MAYASQTNVNIDRSKSEIEHLLRKYGATKYGYMSDSAQRAVVVFELGRRPYRLGLEMPGKRDYETTPTGRERSQSETQRIYDQACRQKWRALFLLIKAKLVGIDEKLVSFEKEFLPWAMLPNGQNVADYVTPQLDELIENKKLTLQLPGTIEKE